MVTDLTDFKSINAEYVQYFGRKPPVRVTVQIPGDEVIMSVLYRGKADEVENLHV